MDKYQTVVTKWSDTENLQNWSGHGIEQGILDKKYWYMVYGIGILVRNSCCWQLYIKKTYMIMARYRIFSTVIFDEVGEDIVDDNYFVYSPYFQLKLCG